MRPSRARRRRRARPRAVRERVVMAVRRAPSCGRSRFVDDPYAAGQHRGIDVGGGAGEPASARPRRGRCPSRARLPGMGRARHDPDGRRLRGDAGAASLDRRSRAATVVDEGATVGAVGASEDPVTRAPHVHLGVRVSSDPNGYVDPLSLLPRDPRASSRVGRAAAGGRRAAGREPVRAGCRASCGAAAGGRRRLAANRHADRGREPAAGGAVTPATTPSAEPVQVAEPVAAAAPRRAASTTAVGGSAPGSR